jgi:hypothetical protein
MLVFLLAMQCLAGCGGGPGFVPDPGAFSGNFRDASAADVGDLSFTAFQTGLAGTGVLHNGALDIDVAVAGNVSNGVITGTVSNSFLGTGTFKGKFAGSKAASGTYSFEIVTGTKLTGTWNAAAP